MMPKRCRVQIYGHERVLEIYTNRDVMFIAPASAVWEGGFTAMRCFVAKTSPAAFEEAKNERQRTVGIA